MHVWTMIGGAICVAVTVVGLVLSWAVWRKQGAVRGLRGVAWSLLPLAAYLTGAVRLLGTMVSAIVRFAGSFVFSPKSWAGVIVVGIAVLLFLSSGGLPLLNWRKARERRKQGAEAAADGGEPATSSKREIAARKPAPARTGGARSGSSGGDDDMSDVEEILKRRGIS